MGNITIIKRGRPTKYSASGTIYRAKKYTQKALDDGNFPTIEGLALELGVSSRTLYGWQDQYPEFLQMMDRLKDLEKHQLTVGGLTNKYNARMAIFLLKACHGVTDTTPPINATQINNMNISPEVLADALKILNEKNDSTS